MPPWKTIAIASAAGFATVGILSLFSRSARAATVVGTTRRSRRVALLGDSYAVGLGPELAKLLPGFEWEGHSGIHTSEWVNRSAQCNGNRGPYMDHEQGCGSWLTQPDVVLVSLGVNDRDHPNRANYQAILRSLQELGARVVWIEPPAGVRTPTDAVRQIVRTLGVETVPATQTPVGGDGLHPVSYSSWAREIAQVVQGVGNVA